MCTATIAEIIISLAPQHVKEGACRRFWDNLLGTGCSKIFYATPVNSLAPHLLLMGLKYKIG